MFSILEVNPTPQIEPVITLKFPPKVSSRPPFHRDLKRLETKFMTEVTGDRPANDFSRVNVYDRADVNVLRPQLDVRQICGPDLIGPIDL